MCVKVRAVHTAAAEVAVAATDFACARFAPLASVIALLFGAVAAQAAVLPEERADVLYHRYDGGGVTVDGPSVLVRKNFNEKVSINANYYVDHVSSASIDVVTQASPQGYQEDRTQTSIGADYLHDRTLMTVGYINSSESDYNADTYTFDISQDFFGDLTTLSIGFSYGEDAVSKNGDPAFGERDVTRYQYRIGVSQIITPKLILAFAWENIADDGYLKSPYRIDYFLDPDQVTRRPGEDAYPQSHDSDAFALRALYYLPYRAALKGEYKYTTDDWDIVSHSAEIAYTHPLPQGWMLDLHVRYYTQDRAFFYYDILPYENAYEFHARDKELSTFSSITFGFGISYELGGRIFAENGIDFIDKGSINLAWDRIQFDYDDFRDITANPTTVGDRMYSFDADVIRLYFSVWY